MNWFSSDLHLGHDNIISFCERPFTTVQVMNEKIINNINKLVSPNDTLYLLGDVSFLPADNTYGYIKRINCPVVLIRGNHDHSNRIKNVPYAEIYREMDIMLGKHVVTLSHFPYSGDSGPYDRFPELRPKDVGLWLLHGHTHSKERIQRQRRMIHVGMDAWQYHPISELDVIKLIENNE